MYADEDKKKLVEGVGTLRIAKGLLNNGQAQRPGNRLMQDADHF
jgi:hypothetical protein